MQLEVPNTSDLDMDIKPEIKEPKLKESQLNQRTVTPSTNNDPTTPSTKPKARKKANKKMNKLKCLVLHSNTLKFICNNAFDHSPFRNKEVCTWLEMDK